MLDITQFRNHTWGDTRMVQESQRRRRRDVHLVDVVVESDLAWRELHVEAEALRKAINALAATRAPSPRRRIEAKLCRAEAGRVEAHVRAAAEVRQQALASVPNMVHQEVPCILGTGEAWRTPRSMHATRRSSRGVSRNAIIQALRAEGFSLLAGAAGTTPLARCVGRLASSHGGRVAQGLARDWPSPPTVWVDAKDLPFQFIADNADHSSRAPGLECWVVAPPGPASWDALDKLRAIAVRTVLAMGASATVADLPAERLDHASARTYEVRDVEEAFVVHVTNHVDFLCRGLAIRCHGKVRDHHKLHPTTCMLTFSALTERGARELAVLH